MAGIMAFEFDATIRDAAFARQQRRCAFCGEPISKRGYQGHHVIPKQLGNSKDAHHALIGTVENCVDLCVSSTKNCHGHIHESQKYKNGTVPFPGEFKFSHGGNDMLHTAWAARLSILYNDIF